MREAIEARKRGEMALRREQFQLAIDEFSKAVQLDPRNGESAAMLAWAQFCVAPDKRAVAAETRRALERSISDTDQPTPQLFLGRVERMMGRQREALRIFREILDLHPGHTEAQSEARVLEQRLSRPK
jgi:cytochrome c-type biogenesis protein CcmH/NrfG